MYDLDCIPEDVEGSKEIGSSKLERYSDCKISEVCTVGIEDGTVFTMLSTGASISSAAKKS